MSTGVIVAIVAVGVLLILGVIALIRARSDKRALVRRRQEAATQRREHAESRTREAEAAERQARIAQAEAEKHRAEARLANERAEAFEQGQADDELRAGDGAPERTGSPEPDDARERERSPEPVQSRSR